MTHKFSILVVDDEFIVRDSLSKWFTQDGYKVGVAENAAQALKLMKVFNYISTSRCFINYN